MTNTDSNRLDGQSDSIETRLPRNGYDPKVTESVYAEMRRIAERLLRAGHSVIADAEAGWRRSQPSKLWRSKTLPVSAIWLDANIAACRRTYVWPGDAEM